MTEAFVLLMTLLIEGGEVETRTRTYPTAEECREAITHHSTLYSGRAAILDYRGICLGVRLNPNAKGDPA
jgi:hypothetical protein